MNSIDDYTVEFISQFEGFSSKPYLDPTGTPTIGYGTVTYPNGKKVTMKDSPITKIVALTYLKYYITTQFLSWVNVNLPNLTPNQFTAISSLIYNIGLPNFKSSSVYLFIKKNHPCSDIQSAFKMWNRSKGKVLNGLTNRRKKEGELYCS